MENTGTAAEVVMQQKWRQGMKLGRTLYAQLGAQPSEYDSLIGMIDNAHLARYIVEMHNAALNRLEEREAGL
jgi:hypothetical protein